MMTKTALLMFTLQSCLGNQGVYRLILAVNKWGHHICLVVKSNYLIHQWSQLKLPGGHWRQFLGATGLHSAITKGYPLEVSPPSFAKRTHMVATLQC